MLEYRKRRKAIQEFVINGLWCKGSTIDFDSICLGSNPDNPTKKNNEDKFFYNLL